MGVTVHGWRAIDQQPVTSRVGIGAAMAAVVDEVTAMAVATGQRPTVLACWQDAAYVDRPAGLIARLHEHGDLAVACVGRPLLPGVAPHAPLDRDDAMATEWSITAVTPSRGLHFAGHELGTSLPAARVEDGRAFTWRLATDPREVVASTHRLMRELGARIPPTIVAQLATAARWLVDAERPADDGGTHLAERIEAIIETADDHRRRQTAAPPTGGGLTALADWLADAGPRAPALGMIVVHSDGGAVTTALRARAHTLGRIGDLVVDVPPDAAMMVLPGLVGDNLVARTADVRATVQEALERDDVHAIGLEVPAVEARHDLVGSLGRALVELRMSAHAF